MWSRRGLLLAMTVALGAAPAAMNEIGGLQGVTNPQGQTASRLTEITRGFDVRTEQLAFEGHPPITLRFVAKPETASHARRLADATHSALRRLGEWYGPLPSSELTVFDIPWNEGLTGASAPGIVVTGARWLTPALDRTLERTLIGALAGQYWAAPATADAEQRWLAEGLALYSAVKGIHEELFHEDFDRRHVATVRLFGGFVPYTIRSVLWSPSPTDPRPKVRSFDEVAATAEAQRVALALHTMERYIGWPSMQQALEAFHARWRAGPARPADLAAIISEQRGRDVRWFFDEALRFDARFDYGVDAFTSERDGTATTALFDTRVSLRRFGDGVFAGTAEPQAGPYPNARSLLVSTWFEDGAVVHDWWDGRTETLDLSYTSPARARSVSVDPEAMLLLDADRSNNSRTLSASLTETGARLAVRWVLWLQDVMITSTALL